MGKLLLFVLGLVGVLSCKDSNCVPTSKISFIGLNENSIEYYNYSLDSFYIEFPSVVTPNGDTLNDFFAIRTNIDSADYEIADFKVRNSCGETLYKQDGSFPFTFFEVSNLEDGEYDFDFSIILNNKEVIAGANILNVLRK
jgi:hypothetical protein